MDKILKDLIELINSKQGANLVVIDVVGLTTICDFIYVVTANSLVHSRSLSQYIIDFFNQNNLLKKNITSDLNNPWVLIDGGNIIVNIFLKETREFYNLEKLYFNGKVIQNRLY